MNESKAVVWLKPKQKTVGERSIYTTQIIERCLEKKDGETAAYDELTALIGLDVRPGKEGYSYAHSAFKILEKEHAVVFDNVARAGWQRMAPEMVANSSVDMFTRKTKALVKKFKIRTETTADHHDELSEEAKLRVNLQRTLLAFQEHIFRPKSIARLEQNMADRIKPLPFDRTIALFQNKKDE